nr:ferrous iron transport protein A [Nevskia ramosa]
MIAIVQADLCSKEGRTYNPVAALPGRPIFILGMSWQTQRCGATGRSSASPGRNGIAYPCEPFSFKPAVDQSLKDLKLRVEAIVDRVEDVQAADPIAARLRDLGFVAGEPVRVVARGPIGGDPLVVQIGYTRFALRRAEAARVMIRVAA